MSDILASLLAGRAEATTEPQGMQTYVRALDSERVFGDDRSMSRTRVRRRQIALALAFAAVLAGPMSRAWSRVTVTDQLAHLTVVQHRSALGTTVHDYVVAPGDTIWAIASRADPGRDPRPLVDAIEHLNELGAGDLVPGQTVRIPVSG
jgi:nucleoid-associated protein YgaU